MKTWRRDFLKMASTFGLFSWLTVSSRSGGNTQANEQADQAAADEIPFHQLHAEPLVRSSYPVHRRFDNGMAQQSVVITARGLERVDWEVQPEKHCWILLLPEMAFVDRERWDYQTGMDWHQEPGGWAYQNCPLRNLKGRWRDVGGQNQLAPGTEEEVPVLGRMAATVRTDELGVHYALTLTNATNKPWNDVFFWICLNHYQSRITGYRPHFRVGTSWLPAQEMPPGRSQVHTYYPAPGMVAAYRSSPDKRFGRADTELSFPGVVCWNRTAEGPLLVCHCSPNAMAVGSNQNWPCTDLQLWFGTVAAGEQKSKTGHVLVARCDLKTFAGRADEILERLE